MQKTHPVGLGLLLNAHRRVYWGGQTENLEFCTLEFSWSFPSPEQKPAFFYLCVTSCVEDCGKTAWQKAKGNNENTYQMMFFKIWVPTQIGKIVREVMHIQLNCMYSSLNNSAFLFSPRPCYFVSFTPTISAWFETKQILKLHICILMSFAVCLSKITWDIFFQYIYNFWLCNRLEI